jgi:hypothetical protein
MQYMNLQLDELCNSTQLLVIATPLQFIYRRIGTILSWPGHGRHDGVWHESVPDVHPMWRVYLGVMQAENMGPDTLLLEGGICQPFTLVEMAVYEIEITNEYVTMELRTVPLVPSMMAISPSHIAFANDARGKLMSTPWFIHFICLNGIIVTTGICSTGEYLLMIKWPDWKCSETAIEGGGVLEGGVLVLWY